MSYFVFPLALFLSASLLFVIQPMVAKVLLPVYGGTPAVWTVCMLFFQAVLLISYAYALGLSRLRGRHFWKILHLLIALLSLFFFPLTLESKALALPPEFEILLTLVSQIGLPLLIIGASAPLLQYAYSLTAQKDASDPYYLYVASNAGSLLALLSYPWVIERYTAIPEQFQGWTVGYLLYFVLLIYVLFGIKFKSQPIIVSSSHKTTWRQLGLWTGLSFIPCSLMLGVTFFITTDIAATPLLWVIPLALYLLSFIITFARKPWIAHVWVQRNILFFLIFPILSFILGISSIQVIFLVVFHLLGFFMIALLCHGELINTRPHASKLTVFYLCLALGGVVAGVFNSLVAPLIFSYPYEYPLVILLGLLCIPVKKIKPVWITPLAVLILLLIQHYLPNLGWLAGIKKYSILEFIALALIVIIPRSRWSLFVSVFILFLFIFTPWFKPENVLTQQRNFYGIKRVLSGGGVHSLISQSTLHGFQIMSGQRSDGSVAYYAAVFPVIKAMQAEKNQLHAMILGLGTGIMACQFRNHDVVDMVEIDKQVIDIAENPEFFTYLKDCNSNDRIIAADGRLAVSQAANGTYDAIVVDVFNSDSIPIHLLTQEAFDLYAKKIKSDGAILINISNRHLNLLPVVTAAGRRNEFIVLHKFHQGRSELGEISAEWALLTMNEKLAQVIMTKDIWQFVTDDNEVVWQDNYSNIIPLLKY